jgi:prolipoprotein diacylglyceryl transferase
MIFQAIIWNLDPEIVEIGPFSIRYYGILFALAFVLGYYIFQKIFKNEGISVEVLDRLTIYMIIGTVIGARLGHCLFYDPEHYLSSPLEILMIWKGGLASHGAAIGILVVLYLFVRKEKKSYIWILDRIVIVVALAGFFIRMGNLMNSEIYGIQTNLPWGFVFKIQGEIVPKHPTQIYEALAYLAIFLLLYRIYFKNKGKFKPGLLFSLFLVLVFTARFLIEFIKENQVGFEEGLPLNMGQYLSIPFVILGLVLLYYSMKGKLQKKAR